MPDIDVGSVYARVGLDISELNANEQKAVLKMREMAAEQEKLTQKAMSQKRAVADLTAEIEKMRSALSASQYADATPFEGIDNQKIQSVITQLGALDREYELLNKKQVQQKATVDELSASLEKSQALGLQSTIKQQTTELETANKALEKTNAELHRVKENEEQLKGKLFTTAETEIENKSKALNVMNTSLGQTQTELEDTTNRQKTFDAQLAQNSARVNAGTSINAMVSGLRSMGVVSGDTSGLVSDLVMQLTSMKQAMTAAQTAGVGLAATASLITAGIGIIIAVIGKVISSYKEAQEAQRKMFEDAISYIDEYGEKLDTYQRMTEIINDEKSSLDEVNTARQTLASTFDEMIAGYDDEGNAILMSNEAMQTYIDRLNEIYLLQLKIAASDNTSLENYKDISDKLVVAKEKLKELQLESQYGQYTKGFSFIDENDINKAKSQIANLESQLLTAGTGAFSRYSAQVEVEVSETLGNLNSSQRALLKDFLAKNRDFFSQSTVDTTKYSDMVNNIIVPLLSNWQENIKDLQNTSEAAAEATRSMGDSIGSISGKLSALKAAQSELNEYGLMQTSTLQTLIEQYPELSDEVAMYQAGLLSEKGLLSELNDAYDLQTEIYKDSVKSKLEDTDDFYNKLKDDKALTSLAGKYGLDASTFGTVQALKAAMCSTLASNILSITDENITDLADKYKIELKNYESLTKAKIELAKQMQVAEDGFKTASGETVLKGKSYNELEALYKTVQPGGSNEDVRKQVEAWLGGQDKSAADLSAIDNIVSQYTGKIKGLTDEVDDSTKSGKDKVYEAYKEELEAIEHLKDLGRLTTEQELADLEKLFEKYKGNADARKELEVDIYNLKKDLYGDDYNAQQQHIEDMKALGQLSTAGEIAMYEKLLKEYRDDTEIKMELEKKLYSLKQQMYDDEYNAARKQINHLKNTGQLTTEQEIADLQQLLAKYKGNADIRMQLEEDIYALKQSLLKDEEKAVEESTEKYVSDVYSAVQEALKAKYEAQKDAEQSVLKESIEHWKEWEDETVASIQAQIDELDKLAEAQEHEEKVSKLNQDLQALDLKMQFEHDGYNLSQLQKEKNRIQEELNDEYISQMQKNDKSDLQAELDAAKEKSEAEQKILQEQLDASTEKYDKLTESASLSIEAQKLIITKGQQEIVELIKSYAPDYFDSGETIGEQFVYGLNMSLEGVESYFAAIRQMVIDNQNQVAAAFSGAASDFWKTKTSYEAKIASNSSVVNNQYTTDARTVTVSNIINSSDILDDPIRMNRLCEKIVSYITKNL